MAGPGLILHRAGGGGPGLILHRGRRGVQCVTVRRVTLPNVTDPKPETRVSLNVRVAPASIVFLDDIAIDHGWDRSQAMRNILSLGARAWGRGERMTPPAR